MIGQRLGHYCILEKIGAGGMGEVYRARDEQLERDVAIKLLPSGALADEAARKRFRKEALALSKLNHPNIETVHDFGTQEVVDFLVMEYVAGETLTDKLATRPLPEKEVARLGQQLAEGLTAAHGQGVIHRDLKPGNLRVTPDGRLKILDFGLAKLLRPVSDTAATESFTETQGAAGTLPYMAPEQLRGEKVDARSDLWAAGAVLYEMATGQRAFPEVQGPRLIDAILHQAPLPPRGLNGKISAELEQAILKCLEKEPENRYQSARELVVDLRRLSGPVPMAARPRPRVWRWQLGASLAAVMILAVLVGLDVGGVRERVSRWLGPGAGRIQSLAVLPLADLSADPQQDYFADGMTDALITDLAKIGPLRVISRSSIVRYKKTQKSVPEIAKELKVDALVEGSVLRSGDRVRITAQLIEAATDRHLWAESYERDLRDILALQGDVSRAIAREIQLKLTPQQEAQLATSRPVNPQAHDAYLRGLYHCRRAAELLKGVEFFEQAIKLDPSFAAPYGSLGTCYHSIAFFGVLAPQEAYGKAKAAALKAFELDDSLPDAHTAMAYVMLHSEWNWVEAEKQYKRSLELNPNDGGVHHLYAHFLMVMGRADESVAETLRAAELDPVNSTLSACRGWHCLYASKLDQAMEFLQRTLQAEPKHILAWQWIGQVYVQRGKYEEAIGAFERAVNLMGGSWALGGLGHAYAVAGRRQDAQNVLAELKRQLAKGHYVPAYDVALVYAGLGQRDKTFEWLGNAYQERSALLVHVNWDPRFNPLRGDPRMDDLIRRIGLPAIRPGSLHARKTPSPALPGEAAP